MEEDAEARRPARHLGADNPQSGAEAAAPARPAPALLLCPGEGLVGPRVPAGAVPAPHGAGRKGQSLREPARWFCTSRSNALRNLACTGCSESTGVTQTSPCCPQAQALGGADGQQMVSRKFVVGAETESGRGVSGPFLPSALWEVRREGPSALAAWRPFTFALKRFNYVESRQVRGVGQIKGKQLFKYVSLALTYRL